MAKSDYLENAVLNHVFRGTTFPVPGGLYAALFTVAPSDSGGGTEVTGNGYARVSIARSTGAWAAPSNVSGNQQTSNNADVSFPESTGAWGTVTHFGIFDASTAGNLLYWGALTPSRAVDAAGVTIRVPAGDLRIQES